MCIINIESNALGIAFLVPFKLSEESQMRYTNIALYLVCAVVAGFVAVTAAQMLNAVPYLPSSSADGISDALRTQLVQEGVWQAMEYWGPKIEVIVNFSILAIPAIFGAEVLFFAEKKLFTRQADKHLHIVLPLGMLVALCMAQSGVSHNQQFAFIFGILIIMTAYTCIYQALGSLKKKEIKPA